MTETFLQTFGGEQDIHSNGHGQLGHSVGQVQNAWTLQDVQHCLQMKKTRTEKKNWKSQKTFISSITDQQPFVLTETKEATNDRKTIST